MSSVFRDLAKGLQPAHTQEPQVLDTVPSLFDENNDLISFLDHFETGLAVEQQETPMDLTMPRFKRKMPINLKLRMHIFWILQTALESQTCTVKWLTRLNDWEMHRDDNVPWRMVGLQPWKWALEKHVQRSHEKALANGMPSDVTLLEYI
ncbi:hypothetical protein TNCV_3168411 [Trichonephila clavipes]|nr:hypothetical protein TNCV_3168411 [Trichonephila clavipes]